MSAIQLTHGPIRSQLIALAIPMLAGNILQQLYNTIDAVIVGRFVGEAAFAAVGVAGSVMNLFLFLISGSCSGVGVLLSQFFGADDLETFRRDCFLSTCFGAGATLLLTLLALVSLFPLLQLLQTPEEIVSYTTSYLQVIYLGFPAAFAFHLSCAVLRAMGNTRAALVFLMLSMISNLGLDFLFIACFHQGTAGAAWATVFSQALAAFLCVTYLTVRFPMLLFHKSDMRMDLPLLKRTAHFSLVTALQMCSLYIGKLLVQGTVNSLGTDAISAFTAATRIEGFANSFGDSGATAVSVFIGQNTGAQKPERIRQGFSSGQRLLFVLSLLMSFLMIFLARPALTLVLPAHSFASLTPAIGYLRLVAVFYVFNFWGSGLSGYFHGRGEVNLPVLGTTGHITIRVILSGLLAHSMGLSCVALATGIGWIWVNLFWYFFARKDLKNLSF